MGKNKYKRFQENETFSCVIQPQFEDIFEKDHLLKGNWHKEFFKNDNPITLELGCGRGEYTIALAERHPERNFIGVDIKGARLWRGAKTATENNMPNVAFVRTRIEFINSFFAENEVDEIWITFPDPQLRKRRVKKRLTAPEFLARYAKFLRAEGAINLKTDCLHLHRYSHLIASGNSLTIEAACEDIYGSGFADEILSVKTAYEQIFLKQGISITFLRFMLGGKTEFETLEYEPDNEL
ncbi:MAG: tRNA (guanosine(46)-N7)-methyltransferase TrmB [Rikenellaceae bacterium]